MSLDLPPRPERRFWRRCRLWFRHFRIGLWLLLLALVCATLYLSQIGLPAFLKQPLLEQLRQRGVELEFTRLRLRWHRGLVAEDVRFGRTADAAVPSATVRELELRLDPRALARLRFEVSGLVLRQGRCVWPLAAPTQPPRALVIENIQTELRFLPADVWSVEHFQAQFAGADLRLSGSLTNASSLRDWTVSQRRPGPPGAPLTERLRRWAETVEQVRFSAPPSLILEVHGDARDVPGLVVNLTLRAPGAETPWGDLTQGLLVAHLRPHASAGLALARVTLEAESANTRWAKVQSLELSVRGSSRKAADQSLSADLELRAGQLVTDWASATNAHLTAHWIHALTNPVPLAGRGELHAASAATRWGNSRDVHLAVLLAPATNPPAGDARWAWWTHLQPYQLNWMATLGDLNSKEFAATEIACSGGWLAPQFTVSNLSATLHGGSLKSSAQFDVATREANFELASNFDVHGLNPLLPEKTRRWLANYSWAVPPRVQARGTLVLPAWTNREPDWPNELAPTLCLAGEFAVTNGACLGVPADWARAHVTFTNRVWRLLDLEVGRPEGQLHLEHQMDGRTQDYYWRIHSAVDPRLVRPLLSTNQQRGLDLLTFTTPPVVDGEVWGRSHTHDRIGFRGQVAVSNFTFRGETVSAWVSGLAYTNLYLEFLEPRLWRGTQHLRAAVVAADFAAGRVHITNGFANADVMVVARAIGPKTARTFEPYHFSQPPQARLEGTAPMRGSAGADLVCDVAGGPFQWWKFNVPDIAGRVHWRDQIVTLTNVAGACYNGQLAGWGVFDSAADPGTDCRFEISVSNVNFRALMADLSTRTNRLEGTLGGMLTLTRGNSADWQSWNGQGRARLQDGWIWEIPIFGILSPALDALVPGLGNSRVSEGSARFGITNGLICLDTLEMRAPTMRLQYGGSVDLQGRVDATVQAELLRDAPLVGRVVSLALWPLTKALEYKITGTLQAPQAAPLYIPKLLLLPLNPFRLLKELFPSRTGVSQ